MCNDIVIIEHDGTRSGLSNASIVMEHDNNRTEEPYLYNNTVLRIQTQPFSSSVVNERIWLLVRYVVACYEHVKRLEPLLAKECINKREKSTFRCCCIVVVCGEWAYVERG